MKSCRALVIVLVVSLSIRQFIIFRKGRIVLAEKERRSCPENNNLTVVREYPLEDDDTQAISPDEAIRTFYWKPQTGQPPQARCRFDDFPGIAHFPHAMQILLPCWSYWRYFMLKNDSTIPVLVWNGKEEQALSRVQAYTTSFLNELQEHIGLQIVFDDFEVEAALPMKALNQEQKNHLQNQSVTIGPKQSYFVANRTHDTRALVHIIAGIPLEEQVPHPSCDRPRIRILDRKGGARKLRNAKELAALLQSDMNVTYFEDATFLEQIHFMTTTDILVTGHGAQMTSVWAMPRCGQALEIFPPDYWVPGFFGSLAALAGVRHVGTGADTTWYAGSGDYKLRLAARSVLLCPPIGQVMQVVENDLLPNWRACCNEISRTEE